MMQRGGRAIRDRPLLLPRVHGRPRHAERALEMAIDMFRASRSCRMYSPASGSSWEPKVGPSAPWWDHAIERRR